MQDNKSNTGSSSSSNFEEKDPVFFKDKFSESIDNMKLKSYDINEEDDLTFLQAILNLWENILEKEIRIYSLITSKVLHLEEEDEEDEEDEDITVLTKNIVTLNTIRKGLKEDNYEWNIFIEKILDHISLAQHQKNIFANQVRQVKETNALFTQLNEGMVQYLERETQKLNRQLEELTSQYNKLKLDYDEINLGYDNIANEQKEITKKQSNIQRDFISILGIFAAILLASFGGLSIINNILDNVNVPVGKVMMLGSISIFSVLIIVFLLLNGISKLTERNLRNCNCAFNEECNCKLPQKHPTIYKSFVLISIVFILGSFEMLLDVTVLKEMLAIPNLIAIMVSILILILVASGIYERLANKKSVD